MLLAGELQRVEQRRAGDDGGAVLVVVEDRDLHGPLQLLLDVEALRRLDVLQVDAAEGRLEQLAGADDLARVLGGQFDVEDVDVGEALEQDALAFHDRLAGAGADVAQAQHGRAVGDHRHQVALGGVLVDRGGIALDLQAGHGHAGRVGQAEVALRPAGLGRVRPPPCPAWATRGIRARLPYGWPWGAILSKLDLSPFLAWSGALCPPGLCFERKGLAASS